jgi:hypothetical protein
MFSLKDFPLDIARLICSFGYPEYKEHINEICHQITHHTSSGLLQYNLNLLYHDYLLLNHLYDICIQEFLTYAIESEVLEDLFIQCTKCCCCSKHCHNKPTNYYTDEVSIGENFNESEPCSCTCRQLARMIKHAEYSEQYKRKNKYRNKITFNAQFVRSLRPQTFKVVNILYSS